VLLPAPSAFVLLLLGEPVTPALALTEKSLETVSGPLPWHVTKPV
jgi:hypothetical protein